SSCQEAVQPSPRRLLSRGMQRVLLAATTFSACCAMQVAHAQFEVEISGAGANQYPIAIADFSDPYGQQGRQLAEGVRADLRGSGRFRNLDSSGTNVNVDSNVDFGLWRGRGANALGYGSSQTAGSQLEIRYRLADTVQQSSLDGRGFTS